MNQTKELVLIGAGGHARSLLQAVAEQPAGYVAPAPAVSLELPWLGADDLFLETCSPDESRIAVAMVSGRDGSMALRRSILDRYSAYEFATVVAPTAWVAQSAVVGEGCQLMHGCFVNAATTLGPNCIVNTRAVVEHDCRLGSNVFVGPGAVICGNVTVGDDVFIGAAAAIRPGISICSGAVIGLGAAVVGDITEPGTYAGVPARKIRS